MLNEKLYDSYPEALRRDAIGTLPIQRSIVTGRGVVLAMQSRAERVRRWGWLMEALGL